MSKLSDEEIKARLKAAIVVKRLNKDQGLAEMFRLMKDMAEPIPSDMVSTYLLSKSEGFSHDK